MSFCPRCTHLMLGIGFPHAARQIEEGQPHCDDCEIAEQILLDHEAGDLSVPLILFCQGYAPELPEPLATEWSKDANLTWWGCRRSTAYDRVQVRGETYPIRDKYMG